MMSESRWTLVDKVGVGVCGRAQSLIQRVTFASSGSAAEAADSGEELGLAEGGFVGLEGTVDGIDGFLIIIGVDAEEVLQLLGEMAIAIGGFGRGHRLVVGGGIMRTTMPS